MDNKNKKKISLEEIYPAITESLQGGGKVELPITGTSMLPLLVWDRDTVLIEKSDCVKTGDILFYRRDDGHFVLHRIVGRDEKGYILCGDNQYTKEYGICDRHIIGKVIQINRKGKTITDSDRTYRLYCKIWQWILPVRKPIIKTLSVFRKIKKAVQS